MTTTRCFMGLNDDKTSSRVLQPPGGGSSFSFGMGEDSKPQPARQKRSDSDIFGPPLDNQPGTRRSNPPGGKSTIFNDVEPVTSPKRNPPVEKSCGELGDGMPQKTEGDADTYGNCEDEQEEEQSEKEEKPEPTPVVPAVPTVVPSKRNPPGGKSSLILG